MITLALIGVGRFGERYIATIKKMQGIRLKYLCTSSLKKRKYYSSSYITLSHYNELLKYNDIDGVIIATPASTHYKISAELLKRGFNLLIEKPLTTLLIHAEKLYDLWKVSKPVVLVGHIYLFHPAFQKAHALSKKIGKIYSIDFTSGNWGPFRDDASVLWDWSPHDVAMCQLITNEYPGKIEAWGQNFHKIKDRDEPNTVSINLSYKSGLNVSIHNTRISPDKVRKVAIIGETASILFDDTVKPKLKFFKGQGFRNINNLSSNATFPRIKGSMPLNNQIEEFARCIRTKKSPITDLIFGLEITKIVSYAEEAMNKRK